MRRHDYEKAPGVSFLLWLAALFGLCGLHRFYLGRPITGFLYLVTLGFLGVGQIYDLTQLDEMTGKANLRLAEGRQRKQKQLQAPVQVSGLPDDAARQALLLAAKVRQGRLSVTQGVLATGRTFGDVDRLLTEMARSGYVGVDYDQDGMLVYTFGELT